MTEDKIAHLFAYDSNGNEIGRLVLDMELLTDLYWYASLRSTRQGDELKGHIIREQTDAPRSGEDIFFQRVSEHIGWYKKKSDGSFYMKRLTEDSVQ